MPTHESLGMRLGKTVRVGKPVKMLRLWEKGGRKEGGRGEGRDSELVVCLSTG